MHPDWDLAHIPSTPPPRSCPPASPPPDHWHQRLQHTPGGHLLRPDGNAMLTALATGRPMHLLHLTRSLDAIRASGHLRTFDRHRHALTPAEDHQVTRSVTDRVRAAAPLLDLMLATATGHARPDAGPFIDQLAAAVTVMPYLGHLCFETAAEYLMLHSTSTATKNFAELGEMNNHLYKQLAFTAVDTMGTLFDVSRFRPGHRRLLDLIDGIEPGLSQSAAAFVRDRLAHRFTATALTPAADATTFAFTGAGTDDLRTAAAPLLGQLLFREVRLLDRYPQLYHLFEQEKAAEAWAYWNGRRTALPYNAACGPKGEIGVNPAGPHAQVTVRTAERCTRGLLHPAEQVAAVPDTPGSPPGPSRPCATAATRTAGRTAPPPSHDHRRVQDKAATAAAGPEPLTSRAEPGGTAAHPGGTGSGASGCGCGRGV